MIKNEIQFILNDRLTKVKNFDKVVTKSWAGPFMHMACISDEIVSG